MKKFIFLIELMFFLISIIYSQEIDLSGVRFQQYPDGLLKFNNDNTLTIVNNEGELQKYTYSFIYEFKVPFIIVQDENGTTEKWLTLFSYNITYKYGGLFLYNTNDEQPQWFWGKESFNFENEYNYFFDVSSYLAEGTITYFGGNLSNLNISTPWVEGVEGTGIGEKITIQNKNPNRNSRHITSLMISNGYVSYDKPYLYEYNSRIKKIKITDRNSQFELIVSIDDTPNLQYILLPKRTFGVDIEIMEVYLGSKWKNTCINFIIPIASDP